MAAASGDGAELYYEEFGQGEPLVMVPGLGAHSRIWGPFPKMLAERRRVIVYDPRGLGRSAADSRPLSLELMASDVAAVLDASGAEKADVLGASLGSLVALRFALDFGRRAGRLVLVTPAPVRTRYGDWLVQTLRLLAERVSPEEFIQALMLFSFSPPFFDKSYGMIKEVGRMLAPSHSEMEQIKRQLEMLKDVELPQDLSAIDVPVLILAGQRDVLAPIEAARRLASKLRRSELVSFPDAGHSPFVESTEKVIQEIERFLQRT